mgnify:CR=1 FL=1
MALTLFPENKYWISDKAISITPNAMGLPDYIQVSVVSGAMVMAHMEGITGLDYDAGHNYRRWPLTAAPTVFNTHTEKYVYIAIPRPTAPSSSATVPDASPSGNALIVFPSEMIDIYGKNAEGAVIGSEKYYYLFLNGILTSSGEDGTTPRDWKEGHRILTGKLSTDEAINARSDSEWYQYSSVDRTVTFLKDLTMKAGTWFKELFAKIIVISSGGSIRFGEGEDSHSITGVAELGDTPDGDTSLSSEDKIVTPAYGEKQWLSKKHDDKTEFGLEMAKAKINGTLDVFGNAVFGANAAIHGDLSVGTPDIPSHVTIFGDTRFGTYNKGIEGGYIDYYANAELESLVLRSFLEVPELRYNRTTITVGNEWQTEGGGIIEKVWTAATVPEGATVPEDFSSGYQGIAKLKLEPGEPGAIAIDDKCQGIFHFIDKDNDDTTSDTHDGNYHFKGFTTVYFLVKEIYTAETLPPFLKESLAELGETPQDNQYFRYELRAATCADLPATDRNRWTDASHPQPGMHFAAYSNYNNADRQRSRLKTTSYVIHLTGMKDWTYDQSNIQLIYGWLDGFTMLRQVWDKENKQFITAEKPLHGEGIATGNIYMWGNIDQFDRMPSLVSQQLYFKSTQTPDAPDGISLNEATTAVTTFNGWKKETILPSPEARYIWQQYLYTYSDGTLDTSEVILHTADSTSLVVLVDKPIVSVAISDVFDASTPDDISFTVRARLATGEEYHAITDASASFAPSSGGDSSPSPEGSASAPSLTYTTALSPDQKEVTFNIRIVGFIGTILDGATPEENFITLTLSSARGTANGHVTLAQNREGDSGIDGINGTPGEDAIYATLTVDTIVIPTVDGDVAEGAVTRSIIATIYKGNTPLTPVSISADTVISDAFTVSFISANSIRVNPIPYSPWTDNNITLTIVARDTDNNEYTRQKTIQIIGSAQGQTVMGPQGASVTKIAEQWQATASGASASALTESGWQNTHIDPTPALPIVWNREIVTFSDPLTNTTREETTEPHICCEFSDGLLKHESLYLAKDNATVPEESSSGWTSLTAAMTQFNPYNRYFWNKETVEYKDSSKNRIYIRLVAVWGEKGEPTLAARLTADTATFRTNAYGNPAQNTEVKTDLQVLLGTTPQSITDLSITIAAQGIAELGDSSNASIAEIGDATVSYSADRKTATITLALSASKRYSSPLLLTLTATCAKGTVTKVFSATPVPSGYNGAKPDIRKWSEIKDNTTVKVYRGYDDDEFYTMVVDDTSDDEQWYTPLTTHFIAQGERLTNTALWQRADKQRFVATSLFFANRAYINNLGVNNLLLTDGTGLYGGMCIPDKTDSQHLGDIRFWLGGDDPQKAPARIDKRGSVVFNEGTFEGKIHARNLSQNIIQCAEHGDLNSDYFTEEQIYENLTFDDLYNTWCHYVPDMDETYFSVVSRYLNDRDSRGDYSHHVTTWIVLPTPSAAIEGKVLEVFAPNTRSISYLRNGNREYFYHYPVGVTSLGTDSRPDGYDQDRPMWVDSASTDLQGTTGTFCTLFDSTLCYTAVVLCPRRFAKENVDASPSGNAFTPLDVSSAKFICARFAYGNRTIYRWVILDAKNVLPTSSDQISGIDIE